MREILEECSVVVSVDRLLYHHDLVGDSDHYFYACSYCSGQVALGGEELEESKAGDLHEPMWVSFKDLHSITLYPLEVRDWLADDLVKGFVPEARTLKCGPGQLRED
ncbi:MAG: hypothetical protein AMXMBFR82_06890 [Candidatus Hydrogenedentota bacterium]